MNIKLIYSLNSNCSQRALWALNYKQVPHGILMSDKLSREELLAASPLGKVPAVLIDEKPLAESLAIIEFLEETFPKPPLLPADSYGRAKVREVAEIVNGTIHAVQAGKVAKFFIPEVTPEEIVSFRRRWIEKNLSPLQDRLFRESSFAVGAEFTLADIFVIPIFVKGLGFGMDAKGYPAFVRQVRQCQSDASLWATCPADLRETVDALLPRVR